MNVFLALDTRPVRLFVVDGWKITVTYYMDTVRIDDFLSPNKSITPNDSIECRHDAVDGARVGEGTFVSGIRANCIVSKRDKLLDVHYIPGY